MKKRYSGVVSILSHIMNVALNARRLLFGQFIGTIPCLKIYLGCCNGDIWILTFWELFLMQVSCVAKVSEQHSASIFRTDFVLLAIVTRRM